MPHRIRLLIVGAARALDTLRPELEASGLDVVGEVSDVAEAPDGLQPDVVLVGDARSLGDVAEAWQERSVPALVVVADDPRSVPDIGRLGAPGWAIVTPDSTGGDLRAAIAGAARGFAMRPVLDEPALEDDEGPLDALTTREREVLELLSEGLSNKAIASRLGISEHTVKFHLSSIFSKLGVSSRTEAVRRGVRTGLIDL